MNRLKGFSFLEYGEMKQKMWVLLVFLIVASAVTLLLWAESILIGLGASFVLLIGGFILLKPARVLFVFLALLPLHQMMMMLLFHFSGSWTTVKIARTWKDVLALGTFAIVAGIWVMRGRWFKLRFLDWLMILYSAFNFIHILGPWSTPLITRLFGVRANVSLVLFYFLGRLVPLNPSRQRQVVSSLLILGALAGIFSLIDRFVLPIDWPVRIGLREYLSQNSGMSFGWMGLSWTYWTSTGVRRASSFFANPLDLAASVHLTGVTALVVVLSYPRKSKGRFLVSTIFGLIVASLLLSISRMSMAVFFLEILLVVTLMRRYHLVLPILILAIGIVLILAINPQVAEFIYQTTTFENPSIKGHLQQWEIGVEALRKHPFGLGPGTSGWVGTRFGNSVGGESQYIVLGVELGFLGILFYVLIQVMAAVYGLRLFKHTTGSAKVLALVAFVSRIGIGLVGITAPIETYIFVAFINWWLIGFVTQQLSSTRPTTTAYYFGRDKESAPQLD